jgi:hypothetical protein
MGIGPVFYSIDAAGQEVVMMSGKMDIDDDGRGPSLGDPDYQNDTSLHQNGQPLDATQQLYVVSPPEIIENTIGKILGCLCLVFYNGLMAICVVGDRGPAGKGGEASIATANALGIPSSPTSGGVPSGVVYVFFPNIAAPGFQLQSS